MRFSDKLEIKNVTNYINVSDQGGKNVSDSISDESEIVDVEVFKKTLQAKPLKESSRIEAEKLKSVLKGEYSVFLYDDDDEDNTVEVPFEAQGLDFLKNNDNLAPSRGSVTSSVQDDNSIASDTTSKCFSVLSETYLEDYAFDRFTTIVENDENDAYLLDNYWTKKEGQREEAEFLQAIDHLLSLTNDMAPPRFRFEVSTKAAQENLQLLRNGGYDWDGLLTQILQVLHRLDQSLKHPKIWTAYFLIILVGTNYVIG